MSLITSPIKNTGNPQRSVRQKKQQGVGLTEVLIAMFIIGMGILGLSSMQITAKKTSYDALQRSVATALARDFIERMRSNPSAEAMAIYGAVNNLGSSSVQTEPSPNCKTDECTPAELATHDIWEWEQALDGASEKLNGVDAGGLVTPSGCVSHATGTVMLTIAWKGHDGKVNPTGSTCGQGLGKYGTNDVDRKIFVVTTFIAQV